jgi:cation-transporting ATPase F
VKAEEDQALRWCLLAGALSNDANLIEQDGRWEVIGDPTEGALLVAAAKGGLAPDRVAAAYPRLGTVSFSSERRYMATLHRDTAGDAGRETAGDAGRTADNGRIVLAKGAVERVLALCDDWLDAGGRRCPVDRVAVLDAAEELASTGLRVLATATGHVTTPDEFDGERLDGLALTGLQAMLDPPRPAAVAAVGACRTAGIDVKMITGDHAATAVTIARNVELIPAGVSTQMLTGADLARLPPSELPEAVNRTQVLARVSPEQKLRLVEALQQLGHVVAMTGDGVNDAPALRRANIGVAMGRGGTEVAKDAADMVLTDDDFATVEAAVEEGRGVFDNLTKFIVWTLPTNMGEGLVILAAIMAGSALPILPTQILWINMTTAVALGLMLAFEPKEAGIMTRPPRDPGQPLLTGALVVRILLVSALLVAGSWWLFEWERADGASLPEARTAAVNVFVVVEAFYLFSCRSLGGPAWRLGPFTNPWIIGGVLAQAAGQVAITYLPAMNQVFQTAPIGAVVWLRILAIGLLASAVVAVDKRVRRRVM